jgi:hypothetical protein
LVGRESFDLVGGGDALRHGEREKRLTHAHYRPYSTPYRTLYGTRPRAARGRDSSVRATEDTSTVQYTVYYTMYYIIQLQIGKG